MINTHQAKYYLKHFLSAKRKGHDVHSPFAYQLCEEVFYNKNSFYDFVELAHLRKELSGNDTVIKVEDFGAGSKAFSSEERTIKSIVKRGNSTQKQSEILYKLINLLKPNTILELGTSLGLNTLYLAGAGRDAETISIEGCRSLFAFAKKLSEKRAPNCNFILGKFDDALPEILDSIPEVDVLYVDGNHTYEATTRYFKMAAQKKCNDSVFIFDDIYWSEGMTKAWEEIKSHDSITLSIDTFHFGMVFFRKEIKEKIDLKLWI
jgi:predicted O-methyltransferase YrrM